MARRAIVTRTIAGTEVHVLGLNTESGQPETQVYVLAGTYKKEIKDESGKVISSSVDESKMLKDIKKLYDTDTFVNVKIQSYSTTEKMYGMYEEDFIAHAMMLDPQTRKPLEVINNPQ